MKVNEAERITELKSMKRRLFNLENELSMEKQKSSIMKGELEAKQVSVNELNQKLCDLSAYARVKIHQLGSELAWHKHQKLEDTIGDLPKVLKPSDELVKLRSSVRGLKNRVQIQEEHIILQKQSYELLRQQFEKLQANFKHPNLAAVLEKCRRELKRKGDQIRKLGHDLATKLLENKSLRKQIAAMKSGAQYAPGPLNHMDANEREEDVISVTRSPTKSVGSEQNHSDSEQNHSDIHSSSSCRNDGNFFYSLDSSPSLSPYLSKATSPQVVEVGNKTDLRPSFDCSPKGSCFSSEETLKSSLSGDS